MYYKVIYISFVTRNNHIHENTEKKNANIISNIHYDITQQKNAINDAVKLELLREKIVFEFYLSCKHVVLPYLNLSRFISVIIEAYAITHSGS